MNRVSRGKGVWAIYHFCNVYVSLKLFQNKKLLKFSQLKIKTFVLNVSIIWNHSYQGMCDVMCLDRRAPARGASSPCWKLIPVWER